MAPLPAGVPPELWRASPEYEFDTHAFGDEVAVFVRTTADTHALTTAASMVLMAMLDARTVEQCADQWFDLVFADSSPTDDRAERDAFAGLLAELAHIGVVQRLSP